MQAYKRPLVAAIICLLFLGFLGGSTSQVTAQNQKIVLSVWTFRDELKKFIDRFEDMYHGIKIELTIVPYEDYLHKIKAVLEYGTNPPDLFAGEYGHLREVVESGYWEDLSSAPHNADVSDVVPYLVQAGTDAGLNSSPGTVITCTIRVLRGASRLWQKITRLQLSSTSSTISTWPRPCTIKG